MRVATAAARRCWPALATAGPTSAAWANASASAAGPVVSIAAVARTQSVGQVLLIAPAAPGADEPQRPAGTPPAPPPLPALRAGLPARVDSQERQPGGKENPGSRRAELVLDAAALQPGPGVLHPTEVEQKVGLPGSETTELGIEPGRDPQRQPGVVQLTRDVDRLLEQAGMGVVRREAFGEQPSGRRSVVVDDQLAGLCGEPPGDPIALGVSEDFGQERLQRAGLVLDAQTAVQVHCLASAEPGADEPERSTGGPPQPQGRPGCPSTAGVQRQGAGAEILVEVEQIPVGGRGCDG